MTPPATLAPSACAYAPRSRAATPLTVTLASPATVPLPSAPAPHPAASVIMGFVGLLGWIRGGEGVPCC